MISIAVLILRVKQPDLPRPFRTPFLPFVSILGALFNIGLMFFVKPETWVAFLIWTGLGVLVYLLYSRKHSQVNKFNFEQSLRGHDAIVNVSENLNDDDDK